MRSLLIPLGLTTDARGLTLETYLDPAIDTVRQKCRGQVLRGKSQAHFLYYRLLEKLPMKLLVNRTRRSFANILKHTLLPLGSLLETKLD